jgi:hypothetical protein
MREREGRLRRGGVAILRIGFEAAQDHLLEPGRDRGVQRSRRRGLAVEALPQGSPPAGITEGAAPRGEEVEHHAEREKIAPRIGPVAEHLLGGNVGRGAERQVELFREKIGQLIVPREAEIDQHRLTRGPHHHVGGLEVEMDHVLAVEVVESGCDFGADLRDALRRQRRLLDERQERGRIDALHHDVGLNVEAPLRDEARHMGAFQPWQDHPLDLEAHDGARALAIGDERDLHDQGQGIVPGVRHPPDHRHAALVQAFFKAKSVDDVAGLQAGGHGSELVRGSLAAPIHSLILRSFA